MSGLDLTLEEAGCARETEGWLSNIVPRLGFDPAAEVFPFFFGTMWADQHAISTGFADGLHHEFVKMLEYITSL